MDKRRGVERLVGPQAAALGASQATQFVIEERQQYTQRRLIPRTGLFEQHRHITRHRRRHTQARAKGTVPAGRHEAVFNAAGLPTGVYLYRLQAGRFTQSRRMLRVR